MRFDLIEQVTDWPKGQPSNLLLARQTNWVPILDLTVRPEVTSGWGHTGSWVTRFHNADSTCHLDTRGDYPVIDLGRDELLVLLGMQQERARLGLPQTAALCAVCLTERRQA